MLAPPLNTTAYEDEIKVTVTKSPITGDPMVNHDEYVEKWIREFDPYALDSELDCESTGDASDGRLTITSSICTDSSRPSAYLVVETDQQQLIRL